MDEKRVLDWTDAFDRKLELLRKAGAPQQELDAAISVYERVRTAKAMAQALLGGKPAPSLVVALAAEIGAEVQRSQGSRSRR